MKENIRIKWLIGLVLIMFIAGCTKKNESQSETNNNSSHHAVYFSEESFKDEVLASAKPVLVDFWAEWCGPCKVMAPIVDELSGTLADQVKIGKVNVDQYPNLARQYNVRSIPTFLVFQSGQVSKQWVGAKTKKEIIEELNEYIL